MVYRDDGGSTGNLIAMSHSRQYEKLKKAFMCDSIVYITGLPSVGKTELDQLVRKVWPSSPIHVTIDCYHATSPSTLYLELLKSLNEQHEVRAISKKILTSKTITVHEFNDFLRIYLESVRIEGHERILITYDHVDLLRRTSMLDTLQALTYLSINLILISEEYCTDVINYFNRVDIRIKINDRLDIITVPPFKFEETVDIIYQDAPKKHKELYKQFVNNTIAVIWNDGTKNFNELKNFCQLNFARFLNYYEEEIDKYIRKKEKMKPDDVYDREDYIVAGIKVVDVINDFLKAYQNIRSRKDKVLGSTEVSQTPVCYATSLMIFATFIAANTTPATDKINFVKLQKKRLPKLKEKYELKPREFTRERLIHIYEGLCSITRAQADDQEIDPSDFSDSVLSDIKLLEDLNIIQITTGDVFDSTSRYKLSNTVPQSFFERVAKQINIPLHQIYGLPCTIETRSN